MIEHEPPAILCRFMGLPRTATDAVDYHRKVVCHVPRLYLVLVLSLLNEFLLSCPKGLELVRTFFSVPGKGRRDILDTCLRDVSRSIDQIEYELSKPITTTHHVLTTVCGLSCVARVLLACVRAFGFNRRGSCNRGRSRRASWSPPGSWPTTRSCARPGGTTAEAWRTSSRPSPPRSRPPS